MIAPSGPWTLGTLIWPPVCAAIVTALVVASAALWRHAPHVKWKDDETPVRVASITCAVVALLFAAGTAFGMYPYNSEYHQWRTVHGRVQKVSSRLIGGDGSVSQRFVVQIDGQPFGVDDTRASLLVVGDTVTLKCVREWQYAASSGWGCNWGGSS
jgi:hypothetical protein